MTITRTTPLADLPELLRVDEAAAWLGVGRGTIYEMVRRGDLGHVMLRRLVRVRRDALAALAGRDGDGNTVITTFSRLNAQHAETALAR